MKYYTVTGLNGEDVEICKKTRKNEKPKKCEYCDKSIKKGMYFYETDAGDVYCIKCCKEYGE